MSAVFTFLLPAFATLRAVNAINSQPYSWKNVKIGGGGGFTSGIVFSTKQQGVAYARTDMGGIYKLNADDTWTALTDWAGNDNWDVWGSDALALDPSDAEKLYVATGMYTNWWDPNNGAIYKSVDGGSTWTYSQLPFKVGGNMPGRGLGERLAVDPKLPSVLYFGARSGNGLWKSTNSGVTWSKVTSFTWPGTYIHGPSDTSGQTSDIIGISWITFDSTSGTAGMATPRIFVGVANMGADSVFVSNDAGTTWSAIPGQPTQFIPHKGVLSPSEKLLYISYADCAGPFDGTNGYVYKYSIPTGVWTDISPVPSESARHGFGGLAVDLKKPGTIMVAALNSWWPDGQIWRSADSGTTWSPLWAWTDNSNSNRDKYYSWDTSLAPWLSSFVNSAQVGWMMEALVIDPFDSDHWLYGTGASIWGGHDLTNWDIKHNVTLKSLADGLEQTAVLALISPPTGSSLFSGVGDVGGFAHADLDESPSFTYANPTFGNTVSLDYAGNMPSTLVRIGSADRDTTTRKLALSYDSGASWSQDYDAALGVSGGVVGISADADIILWRDAGTNTVKYSHGTSPFTASIGVPPGAAIASDKQINTIFYAASGNSAYVSNDGGVSFTAAGTLGYSTKVSAIIVNWATGGDLWITTDVGLFHSSDFAASFYQISGFTYASGVALGAPKVPGDYPAVFASAVYSGAAGYFQSDDAGVNWVQTNDAAHGFGSISANVISGDPRTYGRIYIGTNGRGIFYGDINDAQPSEPVSASGVPSTSRSVTTTPNTTSTLASTNTTNTLASANTTSILVSANTTSTLASVNTADPWGQCGGKNWSGPTSCGSGWTCVYQNPHYYQCLRQGCH